MALPIVKKTPAQLAAEKAALTSPAVLGAAPAPPKAAPVALTPPPPRTAPVLPVAPVKAIAPTPVAPPPPVPKLPAAPGGVPDPTPDNKKDLGPPLESLGPVTDAGKAKLEESAAGQAGDGNDAFDQAVADLLMEEVQSAGKADTRAEEDLINTQMGDEIGGALVNQRASMGRSGFGASGAMAASEGDIQRTARQQGLEDVLGLRRTEDQRSRDNASKAIGSDIDMRKQSEDEFFNRAMLDTLNSALGVEGAVPGSKSDPGGVDGRGGGYSGEPGGGGYQDPKAVDVIPDGATRAPAGLNKAGQDVWMLDGVFYTKKRGG